MSKMRVVGWSSAGSKEPSHVFEVDHSTVGRKPQSVSHEAAAAAATPDLTALQFLRDLGWLKAGGKVLIIGAAGGVDSLAVGVAKRLAAHMTAERGAAELRHSGFGSFDANVSMAKSSSSRVLRPSTAW